MSYASFISKSAFVAGAIVLAASPAVWLVQTWADPSYASHGGVFFCATALVFCYAVSSPLREAAPPHHRALIILGVTALIRLASERLAINTLGALVLAADVYAIALIAGLQYRRRTVSPFWLAVSFLFCLPVERIVQRILGYGLQSLSADGACMILGRVFGDVSCAGVRITVQGADVLVDLPCSGARAVLLFLFGFTLVAALVRPSRVMAAVGCSLAILAALVANILRVVLLASGVALTPDKLGFDVMAQPWHDLVGLLCLAVSAPIILIWARRVHSAGYTPADVKRTGTQTAFRPRPILATGFVALALMTASVPSRPVDVGAPLDAPTLPHMLVEQIGRPLTLSAQETAYFVQYGGNAARATYGDMGLLVTRTWSPLRHLHMPDDCLRGAGFEVRYLGMRFEPFPTATYRATSPGGEVFLVSVSFRASDGFVTASVAEAVWHWLARRHTSWTAIQRITPELAPPDRQAAFEAAVTAAFDLSYKTANHSGDYDVADLH